MTLCIKSETTDKCAKCGHAPGILHRPLLSRTSVCARCCGCAAKPAAAKPTGIVASVAAKAAAAVARWRKDHAVDPFYSDRERREAVNNRNQRRQRWIPDRPGWLQRNPARHVSAAIISPDGTVRPVQPPDYTPQPFDPEGR